MNLQELKIIVATFRYDELPEGSKRYLAQIKEYPVRNGSGRNVDEAVEDLCLQIILYLHNKRTGRQE